MGADMMARTLYLHVGATINLTAAKTAASQLCRQATVDELRTLLEHGWVVDDTLPDLDTCGDDDPAARTEHLRQVAEQELHTLLDLFARSLHTREVHRYLFSSVEAYTTGGLSNGDSPTDAYDDWDIVFDDHRFPDGWTAQLGSAAGLLHPWGTGPAAATVTFHVWD